MRAAVGQFSLHDRLHLARTDRRSPLSHKLMLLDCHFPLILNIIIPFHRHHPTATYGTNKLTTKTCLKRKTVCLSILYVDIFICLCLHVTYPYHVTRE